MGFQPIMPTFQGLVSEEELLQLVAYVKSLSKPSLLPLPAGEGRGEGRPAPGAGSATLPPVHRAAPPSKEKAK